MAESNATQVILTDDGLKIINAQKTADNAAGGVANLNDPNIMSVTEKQQAYYGSIVSKAQYEAILVDAKNSSVTTSALTNAYNAMVAYGNTLFADLSTGMTIDRDQYVSLNSSYASAYTAVQNQINVAFTKTMADNTSQVALASQAASQAGLTANSAAGIGNAASSAAADASQVASQASTDYKTLSSGVADGSVVHITTETVIDKAAIGTTEIADAAITDAKIGNINASHITAGAIDFSKITGTNINASNITTGTLSAARLSVGTLSALSANLGTITSGTIKGNAISGGTITGTTISGTAITGGTISGTTITGTTINGGTFNSGVLNSGTKTTSNGAIFYPLTVDASGSLTSTQFRTVGSMTTGLRTKIINGTVTTNYREMTAFAPSKFYANDTEIGIGHIFLTNSYTAAADPNFSGAETTLGAVEISADTGINLYGNAQAIVFDGVTNKSDSGITLNSYGNIIAGTGSGYWWIVDGTGTNVAGFGTDTAKSHNIQFKRDLAVGNINLNQAHSIISYDGKGLYINSGAGGRADLNVATLNYTGSLSKSLLSEKQDIESADTAYWSQLVNSIELATYQYNDDDNISHLRLSGIVDDVNAVKQWHLPDEFIGRDEDGNFAGIENLVLQNAMLATIQEQQKQISSLNTHLLELEGKLNG